MGQDILAPLEHTNYWPYCIDQFKKLPQWYDRFKQWKAVIEEYISFFTAIHLLEQQATRELSRLHFKTEESDFSGADGLLKPLHQLSARLLQEHIACEKRIGDSTLKKLQEIKLDVVRKCKSFRAMVEKAFNDIIRDRSETVSSQHEKTSSKRQPGQTNRFLDPWITERVLHNQLRKMVMIENKFQEDMIRFQRDAAHFDAGIVLKLQAVFAEFSNIQSNQWHMMQSHLQVTKLSLDSIEPSDPITAFSEKFDLLHSPVWTNVRTLPDFPYKIDEINIVKHSILHRPGSYRKSNWKPSLFVITESGYLHCFRVNEALRKPTLVVKDIGHQISGAGGDGGNSNNIASTTTSITTYNSIKINKNDPALDSAAVYDTLNKPETFFSICLGQPRVSVEFSVERAHLHVFEVTLVQKKRGIFGKQSEVTVKYPIKADSEAEMIEWVALLRDKIEQYIPEGPPTPLFATPEELQAKVDDALASKKATVSSSSAAAVMGTGTGSVVLAADSSFSSTMHQGDVSHAPSTATTASPTRPSSSAIRSSFSPSATPSVLSRSNTTKSIPSAPPLDPHDDHHLYQYHLHQHHHPRGSTAISNSSSASSLSRSVSHNSGVGGGHNGFIQSRKSIRMMGGPRSATPLPPRPVTYCEDASDVENSSSMIMVHDVPKAAEI